ncbi:unnamed protein product [Ambrosiozyma monospora]|uniref:Unnamed protein product n=1 Tax=Ambrosiozyma monospora TaxID=43982 RepID=A0ACB5TV28_AMBMO|nr:unnamed protein product [Ambrosiozyma monospora]
MMDSNYPADSSSHVDFKCPDITFKEWLLRNKRMVTKEPNIQLSDSAVEECMPSAIDVDPVVDGNDIRTALSLGGGGNTADVVATTELTHQGQEQEPTTGDKKTIDLLDFGGGGGGEQDQGLDNSNPKQSKIHHASRFDETEVGDSA